MMLTKHHGLGNDFLIAVAPDQPLRAEDAQRWCDRRRGVGADGLISLNQLDDGRWAMALWNADGSEAELSGNGLRCVGQALLLHRDDGQDQPQYRIVTGAGERLVTVTPNRNTDTDQVSVGMGLPGPGPRIYGNWGQLGLAPRAETGVDMGNPHLVVLIDGPPGLVDVASIGPYVEAAYPDGLNIHFIRVVSQQNIELRVWERGAGVTEACGTGAAAAAWAAHSWDLVGPKVEVTMPGGSALIDIGDDEIVLTGPATFIAVVEVTRS